MNLNFLANFGTGFLQGRQSEAQMEDYGTRAAIDRLSLEQAKNEYNVQNDLRKFAGTLDPSLPEDQKLDSIVQHALVLDPKIGMQLAHQVTADRNTRALAMNREASNAQRTLDKQAGFMLQAASSEDNFNAAKESDPGFSSMFGQMTYDQAKPLLEQYATKIGDLSKTAKIVHDKQNADINQQNADTRAAAEKQKERKDAITAEQRNRDLAIKQDKSDKATTKTNQAAGVRQSLVEAGAKNALARLDDLIGLDDAPKASIFMAHEAKSVMGEAVYQAGRSALSSKQKKIDATMASFIDEAIPVFTGGLRGSDALRKFLIGQLPSAGDDDETAREKIRIFKENINGTRTTFRDFAAAHPAPGVKPDEAQKSVSDGSSAAVKEGQTSVSKSGRPIVFKNGKWIYAD